MLRQYLNRALHPRSSARGLLPGKEGFRETPTTLWLLCPSRASLCFPLRCDPTVDQAQACPYPVPTLPLFFYCYWAGGVIAMLPWT